MIRQSAVVSLLLFLPLAAHAYRCGESLDAFCKQLMAPGGGHVDLPLEKGAIPLRLGKTAQGVPERELAYAKVIQEQKGRLPSDFTEGLAKFGYFDTLARFVGAGESASPKDLETLQSAWSTTIAVLAQKRAVERYPALAAQRPPSFAFHLELRAEETAIRSQLVTDIWKDRPEWKEVQESFRETKKDYVETLKHLPGLDRETRRDWIRRIKSVEIELPSGFDDNDNACSATSEEAHYSIYTNRFVVCPGMFLGARIDHVVAHELSHALGIKRSIREFLRSSAIGQRLEKVKRQACQKAPLQSCPAEWPALRARLSRAQSEMQAFVVKQRPYLECLQTAPKSGPTADDVRDAAIRDVDKTFDDRTPDDWWKTVVQPKLSGQKGAPAINPDFLNPCQPRTSEAEVAAVDIPGALFLTMEYACASAASAKGAGDRSAVAVQGARRLLQVWDEATMGLGGKVSKTHALEKAGVSQDSEERFADTMATEVLATKFRRVKSVADRRQMFLADSAFLCGHGLKGIHLSDQARHGDLLRDSMRSTLDCEEAASATGECSLGTAAEVPAPAGELPGTPVQSAPAD